MSDSNKQRPSELAVARASLSEAARRLRGIQENRLADQADFINAQVVRLLSGVPTPAKDGKD